MKILHILLPLPGAGDFRPERDVDVVGIVVVFVGMVGLDLIGVDVGEFGGGGAMIGAFVLFIFGFEDEVAIIVDGGVDEKGCNFFFILFGILLGIFGPFKHVLYFDYILVPKSIRDKK